MPYITRPCGARLHYLVRGDGPIPVLLLSPGGMLSAISMWQNMCYNPWKKLPISSKASFKVIAMDQRCGAGLSDGPLPKGWETYRDDQLAVLDAAGVDAAQPCLLVGACIGPSFIFSLLKSSPERFSAAVLMQPIGLAEHTTEPGHPWDGVNQGASQHWFWDWGGQMMQKERGEKQVFSGLYESMCGKERSFVFTATREEMTKIEHPMLVLAGVDIYHPTGTAKEIASLAPNATYVDQWRDEHYSPSVDAQIEGFLASHFTPLRL
jgi:pimeloyl-ACP methyl ester carboxylesterase